MCCTAVIAGNMEWLKSLPSSSTGPLPMPVQPPLPSDVDDQRHIQQMLLAMRSMPPAGSRWAAPPVVTAGHVSAMPHAAAMHPAVPHANHVGAPPADSSVEHSVSLVCHQSSSQYFVVLLFFRLQVQQHLVFVVKNCELCRSLR